MCATAIRSGRGPGRALEDLASLALRAAVFLAAGVDNPTLHWGLARIAGEAGP